MFANIPKFIEIVVLMYLPDRILKSKGMLLLFFALEKFITKDFSRRNTSLSLSIGRSKF